MHRILYRMALPFVQTALEAWLPIRSLAEIKSQDKLNMRTWRNWQTRWFQVPVKQFMWVQVPSSAPGKDRELSWSLFLFSVVFTQIATRQTSSAGLVWYLLVGLDGIAEDAFYTH